MHVTLQEVIFFSIIYSVAVTSAVARGLRDRDFVYTRDCICAGISSGFFSLGIISVWLYSGSDHTANGAWFWIGISALLGMMSKEQDKILRFVISGILRGFKLVIDDSEKK